MFISSQNDAQLPMARNMHMSGRNMLLTSVVDIAEQRDTLQENKEADIPFPPVMSKALTIGTDALQNTCTDSKLSLQMSQIFEKSRYKSSNRLIPKKQLTISFCDSPFADMCRKTSNNKTTASIEYRNFVNSGRCFLTDERSVLTQFENDKV